MRKKTIFIFLLVLFIAFLFGSSVYLRGALSDLTAVFEEFVSHYPFFALLVVYASGAFIEADWRLFAALFLIGAAAAALIYYLFERRFEGK